MQTGVVKWWNSEKGYGFIAPSNGGNDIFLHISDWDKAAAGDRDPSEGEEVVYEPIQGNKGMQASKAQPASAASANGMDDMDMAA